MKNAQQEIKELKRRLKAVMTDRDAACAAKNRQLERADSYRATMNRIVIGYAQHGSNLSHEWIAKLCAEHLK